MPTRLSPSSLRTRPSSTLQRHDATTPRRLSELDFIAGELVRLLRRGPGRREPLAVLIGTTMIALRRLEAECVEDTPK